ncbi:MAG: mevalonate kinase [Haloarculaceae archaeon]
MVTASAPGKLYLFGEHAVVYGEPAVACAIDRRATVTVEARDDDHLRVNAADLTLDGFAVEYGQDPGEDADVDVPEGLIEAATGYVDAAVEQARDAADAPDAGFEVTIESEIPLGAGLSSSAAVTVASIYAATRELGTELSPVEVADRAFQVEYDVQDGNASRTDTFCSATGGAVYVEGETRRSLDAPSLPFVVGFDGGAGDTGALVEQVRGLKDRYDFARDTIDVIGDLARRGEDALLAADVAQVGRLMNFNHGLLSALGVSSRSLDAMAWAARDAGAHGAKLTGAGGGGCIVALDPSEETRTALQYTPDCEETFRAELDREGVRLE